LKYSKGLNFFVIIMLLIITSDKNVVK